MIGLLETSILHNHNHNQSRPVWISCDCGCDQLQPVLHATGCRLTCNCCGRLAYLPHKAERTRLPKQDRKSTVIDTNDHRSHHHHPGYWLGQLHAPPPPHLVQAEFYQCATFFVHPLFFFFLSFLWQDTTVSTTWHTQHLCWCITLTFAPFPQHQLDNVSPSPRRLSFSDNWHITNTNYNQVICHHPSSSLASHSPPGCCVLGLAWQQSAVFCHLRLWVIALLYVLLSNIFYIENASLSFHSAKELRSCTDSYHPSPRPKVVMQDS